MVQRNHTLFGSGYARLGFRIWISRRASFGFRVCENKPLDEAGRWCQNTCVERVVVGLEHVNQTKLNMKPIFDTSAKWQRVRALGQCGVGILTLLLSLSAAQADNTNFTGDSGPAYGPCSPIRGVSSLPTAIPR